MSLFAPSAPKLTVLALGFKPRIAQLSADSTLHTPRLLQAFSDIFFLLPSYVQELEARLIQMEGLLTQVGGTTELLAPDATRRLGTVNASPSASSIVSPAPVSSSRDHAAYLTDPTVRQAPSDPDQFGQLAVDANGHLRWIGGSSAMTLVDAFKNISTAAASSGSTTPKAGADHCQFLSNQGKHPVANIYFPPNLRPNTKPRALPGPEEVEFPPRDLADKLVRYAASKIEPLLRLLF